MRVKIRGRAAAVAALAAAALVGATGVAYATGGLSDGVIHGCYKISGGDLRVGSDCTSKEKPLAWNVQGPKGDTGARGAKGDTGDDGQRGARGNDGAKGDKGNAGATGATGPKGEKGDKGDAGAPGALGPQGAAGAQGATGAAGAQGAAGAPGGVSGYQVITRELDEGAETTVSYLRYVTTDPCPDGKVLVGGGAHLDEDSNTGNQYPDLWESYPGPHSWYVSVRSSDDHAFAVPYTIVVYSICVNGS
jgi:hypothetical protein